MKKKIVALCLCVALAVVAIGGATLAYFTDTKTANNTFTMGDVQIKLDETDITKTDGSRTEKGNDYGSMYPGRSVVKDPIIHNEGTNNAYIRAKVVMTQGANILATLFPESVKQDPLPAYTEAFSNLVGPFGAGWSVVDYGFGSKGELLLVFKYAPVLAADESTTAIFNKVEIPASFDTRLENGNIVKIGNFEITVTAEAIQTDSFNTWEAAFTAFDGE